MRSISTAYAVVLSGLFASVALGTGDPPCGSSAGPDVIVGSINGVENYAAEAGLDALSLGTTSCNLGTVWLNWFEETTEHPVIGGTLYKMHDVDGFTRFEQIGQSWLKHGFYALSENLCCNDCEIVELGDHLGVGCSDPYTASRNGEQFFLGPKWQVNPHTGVFTYPPPTIAYSGNTARRLEVDLNELELSSATVRYFGQAQYVTPDDSAAGNQNNNASYREIIVTGGPSNYTFAPTVGVAPTDTTQRMRPGIRAWKDVDASVNEVDVQVLNDGRFILAYKVTPSGDGLWHYEYALHNLNSDRAARSFNIPIADCVNVTNIGFHDVTYRSGDGIPLPDGDDPDSDPDWRDFANADWEVIRSPGMLTWTTEAFSTDENSNALRWGTTYNFRFDADRPPSAVGINLGLFKPGLPVSVIIAAQGPLPGCAGDVNGNLTVNVTDLLALIGVWGRAGGNGPADIAPPCGNGTVNVSDLLALIGNWGPCD